MGTLANLLKSTNQVFYNEATGFARKIMLEKSEKSTIATRKIRCINLFIVASVLAMDILPAEAKRLTALWDPDYGWTTLSSSAKGNTRYLKSNIDYNSTDSAILATQQKGYCTLVWYMANKRPIDFAPAPSKWSQKSTLQWINSSDGHACIEKLRVVGDSHHTTFPDIYESLGSYFPGHTIH
jgi:hypothetical protein